MLELEPVIRKVQKLRKQRGLNQTQFAEYLGVSLATITRWGRGGWHFTPSLAHLAKMAELFDTTVSELLTVPVVTTDETPSEAEAAAAIVTNDESSPEVEAAAIPQEVVTTDEVPEQEQENPNPLPDVIINDESSTEIETAAPSQEVLKDDENIEAEVIPDTPKEEAAPIVTHEETPKTEEVVTNDEPPAPTPQKTKPRRWEVLGMSRGWYYKLRQQGRLEEYLKSREKQPDNQ